jgi:hypothetical protein
MDLISVVPVMPMAAPIANASGVSPFTYLWSTEYRSLITGLSAGAYDVASQMEMDVLTNGTVITLTEPDYL